jgi:hypothetical protein
MDDKEQTSESTGTRPDEVMEAFGEQLGRSAAALFASIRNATQEIGSTPDAPIMKRSEEFVSRAEQTASGFAIMAAHSLRRAMARAREEAEDLAAEAQIRAASRFGEDEPGEAEDEKGTGE